MVGLYGDFEVKTVLSLCWGKTWAEGRLCFLDILNYLEFIIDYRTLSSEFGDSE